MPLVANTDLPGFRRLREEGEEVLDQDRARHQDIRELHIGLLNMMPDAALEVTERQFLRLVGGCNRIAQFYVYPFSLHEISRSEKTKAHIDQHYFEFDQLRKEGLDALIITGTIPGENMADEPFWKPLGRILEWARENVTSTLCACLATHAAMKYFWNIERQPLPAKRWGVFQHHRVRHHPLVRSINTRFDVPHSRFNEIFRSQMEKCGVKVLIDSAEAGVHLAVSPDLFRFVFFQGHPEYDRISLLKEYKREVIRFIISEIDEYPPFPQHYFNDETKLVFSRYRQDVLKAENLSSMLALFPEQQVVEYIDNTWGDTSKIVFNNWLGTVYQITGVRRDNPFMEGVDPKNPLGLR